MKSGFHKLSKKDQKVMASILASAFHKHDNFVYLIENDEKRLFASKLLFRFMTKVMNKYGYIYVVYHDDEPIGYITFMDDKKAKLEARTVLLSNAVCAVLKFWLNLSRYERKKYKAYLKKYDELDHSKEGLIHLYYTGIKPEHKGKGIMKKAMNDALLHFNELGYKGVCLETSDQSNVGLYKHLGYRITQSVKTNDERQEIFFFEKDF